ncbi:hypothetical protein ACJRO7_004767 [Eucalyptus globulus]|uniref:Uncharacterized protein n=1 Tax=Eucalyptus globulus TaxID=34317 RepID=A0ABD3IY30_EUCGL
MLMPVLTQIFSICIEIWPTENSRSSMALTTQNSNPIIVPCGHKPVGPPRYSITVFDPETEAWDLLDPVPDYPDGLPLFCHLASYRWPMSSHTTSEHRGGVAMPQRASFFAVGAHDGRVYVAGGHNEGKNALRSAWEYDMGRGEWAEVPLMSHGRDKCERVMAAEGRSFWVLSGYRTEDQGQFEGSTKVYDFGTGGVAAGREAGSDPAVRAEMCRVELGGGRTLGFYVAEGQNKKLERINVPDKFSEFTRTGCRVQV